jgi:phospholipid/cholesterol/gamma-HCH transport system permease protein
MVLAVGRALRGKARFRGTDLALLVQQSGFEALPIVTLVTFLLGLILAFVGAIQLQTFGATIYVADLVGVAMVRDMGALITGIIMAGRSGAAFAAQLGSMKVTQEIDALETMAISSIDFLVLPRVAALCMMMPFLTLYGDAMGILGGGFVGVTMLGLSPVEYLLQTADAVSLSHVLGGVFKGTVYGALIALAGCLRGMQSGKSSSAVGDAATSAVVTGIVAIIVACGLFAYVFYALGI